MRRQKSLSGGGFSPRRITACPPVNGGPVGWAIGLPSAGAGRATSPATTVAPSRQWLGAGPPVLRSPLRLWGAVPLPRPEIPPHGPSTSVTRGLPPVHRSLRSAAYGIPVPGGRPGAPLRGGHAPARDEHLAGSISGPAVRAVSPSRGRDGTPLGVGGALVWV